MAADPSPRAAAARAAALARRAGARVVLLHVVHAESAAVDFAGLQRELATLLEGVAVTAVQRRGPPAREILAVARDEGADLVLLTPHGRWKSANDLGLSRFHLNSVLCRVLLGADCAVWVEPEPGVPVEMQRLVCGVASLFLDREMIRGAAIMAALMDARLALFRHSVNAAISIPGERERVELWQREVAAAVRADLEALRADLGLEAEACVRPGGFDAALLAEARRGDVIAVRRTSREWSKDETLLPLVRGADTPLLVYPDAPRVSTGTPLPPVSPRTSRLMGWLVFASIMILGLWIIHGIFTRMRAPDCSADAYRCAVRENLMNSTRDRLNQPRPRDDPKLGPFKDDPPPPPGAVSP